MTEKKGARKMIDEDRPDRYYIPDNLNDHRKFFHIPDRNFIETIVVEVVIYNIFKILQLSIMVTLIAGAIVMGVVGALFIFGINNESVTEFIASTISFQKKKRIVHYRRCDQRDYDTAEKKETEQPERKAGEFFRKLEDKAFDRIEERVKVKGEQEGRGYGAVGLDNNGSESK